MTAAWGAQADRARPVDHRRAGSRVTERWHELPVGLLGGLRFEGGRSSVSSGGCRRARITAAWPANRIGGTDRV
jgi:hypothetical protein